MKTVFKSITALALLMLVSLSHANFKEPYSKERFVELQDAGETVLIDVYATWCPTCAWQQAILDDYRKKNPDKRFFTLVVDYDNDKKTVREFRAPRQSTLLLYKDQQQIWFSVAETRSRIISAQLENAINLRMNR
jgi:thioredoxin 1